MGTEEQGELIQLTSDIVVAYVSNNSVPMADLPAVIRTVHLALVSLTAGGDTGLLLKPAVSVKKSITAGYIVCLEDGKKLKMLKRYLRTRYGLSPEEYRAKWGLPADYPMVAPNYAAQRSEFAKKIGLGHSKTAGRGRRRA